MLWLEQEQKCFGSIRIGDNVKIGANAVVLHNVEDNKTVVGVPRKSNLNKNIGLPKLT